MSKLDYVNMTEMTRVAGDATRLLKSLANEKRLMILCQLAEGELSVGELQARLGIGQAPLSQQLARLRRDGLVGTRRAAQTIYYSLAGERAGRLISVLYDMFCGRAPGRG